MWFFNAFFATMGILFGIAVSTILFLFIYAAIIVKMEEEDDGD